MPRICILAAHFYEDITRELIRGAVARLEKAGASHEIHFVPGALELPAALAMALGSGRFDGFVMLGCVIRGETTHYDTVSSETARGLNALAIRHLAAVGNGVLTVESEAQAWARARIGEGDKGGWAADTCLRMLALKQKLAAGA